MAILATRLFGVGVKALLALISVLTCVQASYTCNMNNVSAPATGYNASASYIGCYLDPSVSILTEAKLSTIIMTPEYCTSWCGGKGFAYGGVEFGT
jgi:xylan 1,4-beta-xylosidase